MAANWLYLLAADAILFVHVLFVAFVVLSLVLTYVGWLLDWAWVRNMRFRIAHLVSIGIVVLLSWFRMVCPLTTWEMALRARAGDATYSGTFISHWLETLLYYQAPEWVFAVVYTAFALLVLATWFLVPPNSR